MAGNELVEVVDEQGAVVQVVSRSAMRASNLRHRCVYVVVLCDNSQAYETESLLTNPNCRLIVHQRALWKDTYPGYWDLAFGGVCGVGEQWQTAARRELKEEAGLTSGTLISLGPVEYTDSDTSVLGQTYAVTYHYAQLERQLSAPDGEVVAFASLRLGQLANWMASTNVCPDSADKVVPQLLRFMKKW